MIKKQQYECIGLNVPLNML